jgi:N-acetylglutamate synthase-like GNAT family acetyltransferase
VLWAHVLRVTIRDARLEDWSAVSKLLAAAGLVALDETAQFGPQYAVAEDSQGFLVGVAGYERYGEDILLRSVAVAESHRSAGIGARLTADRLAHAQAAGSSAAYLLTDTASGYWRRHGFVAIERSTAPAALAKSQEWSHACPASATAMKRMLTPSGRI